MMFKYIGFILLALSVVSCSSSEKKYYEKHYQTQLCKELQGEIEFVLEDKTRVDCLTEEYAIEVDFARKWAEGIGQSLHYSHMTGKKPAVALIVNKEKDLRYLKRIGAIAKKYEIKLFMINK